jgi:DNA replication protein DnaC
MKRNQLFWDHYFKISELSEFGNEGVSDKLKEYNSDKDLIKRCYVLANIPEKYFDFEFEQIVPKLMQSEDNHEQIEKLERYLDSLDKAAEKGIGLYLSGEHGVAKTTIATIVLKKAIQLNYRCFFAKSTEIVEFARSGWKNEERKMFIDYVTNTVDFLVIDDIARLVDVTSSEKIHIDKIFTKRDDMNLVTIMTANHEISENKKVFGEALSSNFTERLIPIHLVGKDYRNTIGSSLLEELNGKK